MQVILLERVEKLGQMGQVVDVKPGYARNFLLPKKKALRATKQNLSFFEGKKSQLEASNLKRREEAEFVAKTMSNIAISLVRQASEMGLLYGSVRPGDVVEAVQSKGFTITRSQVAILNPIKKLGAHEIKVNLHPEVSVPVHILIAQSQEEVQEKVVEFEKKLAAQASSSKEFEQEV